MPGVCSITAVVPFRLRSVRFPEKALSSFRGRPLLDHAAAIASAVVDGGVIVTAPPADLVAARAVVDFEERGAKLVPTSESCRCATDRVVEILPQIDTDYVLSIPIDEPALDPAELRRALADPSVLGDADVLTFYCDFFAEEDYLSPLSAKVVLDGRGRLLYMSRAVIPVQKDGSVAPAALRKNVGAFLFRRSALERLWELRDASSSLDRLEGLEQLRWLELGITVQCRKIRHIGFGIDVPEQTALLEARLAADP